MFAAWMMTGQTLINGQLAEGTRKVGRPLVRYEATCKSALTDLSCMVSTGKQNR